MSLNLSENALRVLERRYLKKDETGRVIETPEEMFRRVAKGIAQADKLYGIPEQKILGLEEAFYRIMTALEFMPNSPALMNAGRELGQLSACFVLPIEDSMDSIFESLKATAMIHKSGGGTGFSFSRLRPKNSMVLSTGGIASGPVSFMKVYDAATHAVKQGGCVDENTIISTEKGLLPIKELAYVPTGKYQGLYLKVFTDDGLKLAEQFYNNGIKPVKTVITKDGYRFSATFNHKIRVIDEEGNYVWRELRDVKNEDWVALQMDTFIGRKVKFERFEKKLHFNTKICDLPSEMSVCLAELFGYFIGDGCFHKGKLMLAIPHDCLELKGYFDNYIKETFRISSRFEQKPDDKSINLIYHSQMLVEWFRSIGVDKKDAMHACIPKIIFEGERDCAQGFLRGIFEADGYIDKQGYHISLSSISGTLIHQLQILLLSLGIPSNIRINSKRESSYGRNTLYILTITTPKGLETYKDRIGFLSNKKKRRLESIIKREVSYNDIIPNQSKRFREFYENLVLKPRNKFYKKIYHYLEGVKDERNLTRARLTALIEEYDFLQESFLGDILTKNQYYDQVGEIAYSHVPTLDLVVPEGYTYIANGFVSHNTRRGANMGILRIDHPDISEFITCKESDKDITNFNISISIADDFMQKLEKAADYDLIDPHTHKVVKQINTKEVFDLIVKQAHKNGEPGVIFIDRMNQFNPTPRLGKYESTNPCGEQVLLPYESCDLGSINLSLMYKKVGSRYEIDWDSLREVAVLSVHFLDNLIDVNKFPLPQIEKATKLTRKIGLGVMGWATLLIRLGIPYNSEEAIALAEKVMSFILNEATKKSQELAKVKGAFPAFKGSIYDKKEGSLRVRNATLTTIAPTGTISIIAGPCSSGIEPLFAVVYYRNVMDNDKLVEVDPLFEELAKERGFYSAELMQKIAQSSSIQDIEGIPEDVKRIFVTAFDISPEWHVRMQAAFQRFTHNATSKTINFSYEATLEDVKKAYLLAYELGCKGITIYRDRSREEQVLNINRKAEKSELQILEPGKISPRPRPEVITGTTTKVSTGCGNLYVTINLDAQGRPFELFTQMGKAGGCAASQLEAIGRLVSLAFRSGIEVKSIIEQLGNIRCPSPSWEKGQRIFSCADAIARVIEKRLSGLEQIPVAVESSAIAMKHSHDDERGVSDFAIHGDIVGVCPDCGGTLRHEEGCVKCHGCGFSKC